MDWQEHRQYWHILCYLRAAHEDGQKSGDYEAAIRKLMDQIHTRALRNLLDNAGLSEVSHD